MISSAVRKIIVSNAYVKYWSNFGQMTNVTTLITFHRKHKFPDYSITCRSNRVSYSLIFK